jgi:hypothetical protein
VNDPEREAGDDAADDTAAAANDDAEIELVRRKVERMRRARETRLPLWRHLAHVGVLGWLFILPALGAMLLGRTAERLTAVPGLTVAGLIAGLALGAFLVARSVRRSLNEPDDAQGSRRD